MAHINNAALRGKQNRAAGASFEQIIDTACQYYKKNGIAEIDKTPEVMKERLKAVVRLYLKQNSPVAIKCSNPLLWRSKKRHWNDTKN